MLIRLALLFGLLPALAIAAISPVTIEDSRAFPTIGKSRVGVTFCKITNHSTEDRKLVSVSSDVAETVEMHDHVMEGDIMKMRKVEDIALPAGNTTELKPGGLHIMLINTKQPLKVDDSFMLQFHLDNGEILEETIKVVPR